MKEKIVKIGIIAFLFVLVYTTIVNALSLSVTMTPSSTNVEKSKEFIVKFAVSNIDAGTNGINALSGILKYDESVFEKINNSNIKALNGWSSAYNEENDKITLTKTTFTKNNEQVFEVTFKVLEDVDVSTGSIQFVDINASNSEDDISVSDTSTTITIGNSSGNTANETNTNTNNALVIKPKNNTVENNEVENTNKLTIINNSVSDDMPSTGVEDTILYIIIGLITVAIIFYIKFERVNKELK